MSPVRLQLSRKKGFNLQALSLATNGLPAVSVTRPHSVFQNRWKVGVWSNMLGRNVATDMEVVALFRSLSGWTTANKHYAIECLAGKNLACWCKLPTPGEPDICHAAVLLECVNPPVSWERG